MKIIDLFAGVGGLSLGFEMEGFESVIAIDIWDDAIKTYNHNRKKRLVFRRILHNLIMIFFLKFYRIIKLMEL